jgi:hypothetical protein
MKINKTYHGNFPKSPLLRLRGERGVMTITPSIPLTLRGIFKELPKAE